MIVMNYINLSFCMLSAYDAGIREHHQAVMAQIGIRYEHSVPQSISDSWDFWGCENVPDELPVFLSKITNGPTNYIGWGLSEKTANRLNNILTV